MSALTEFARRGAEAASTVDAPLLLVLIAIGITMFWSLRTFQRWLEARRVTRLRVVCPVHTTRADVAFLVDADGPTVYRNVLECSLVPPGEAIACGKTCRSMSVAPFGEPSPPS